jgi:hypothetical protein
MVDQSRLSMPKKELLDVVRSVYAGRRHVLPEVAARLAEHLGTNGTDTLITIRGEYPEARIIMLTTSAAMAISSGRCGRELPEACLALIQRKTEWSSTVRIRIGLPGGIANCLASTNGKQGVSLGPPTEVKEGNEFSLRCNWAW